MAKSQHPIENLNCISLSSCTGMPVMYMNGQCHKNCLQMVLIWKRSLNSMMMTRTNDISLKLMFVIPSICKRYTVVSCSWLKEWRLTNARNLSVLFMVIKKLCCTNWSPKAALGLLTDTRQHTCTQSKFIVEALHSHE